MKNTNTHPDQPNTPKPNLRIKPGIAPDLRNLFVTELKNANWNENILSKAVPPEDEK